MPSGSGEPQPRLTSHDFGRWGEGLATEHYAAIGFEILARNWRCRQGEIDLIAAAASTVVFVEVKSRSTSRYGSGADAVGWQKQQKIRTVALQWLAETSRSFQDLRFDLATVDRSGAITIYESCF